MTCSCTRCALRDTSESGFEDETVDVEVMQFVWKMRLSFDFQPLFCSQVEGKKSESAHVYLKLPSTRTELENRTHQNAPLSKYPITGGCLTLSTNDGLQITTLVCSTKLTHNGTSCLSEQQKKKQSCPNLAVAQVHNFKRKVIWNCSGSDGFAEVEGQPSWAAEAFALVHEGRWRGSGQGELTTAPPLSQIFALAF